MDRYPRIPTYWSYITFVAIVTVVTGDLPLVTCLDFGDGADSRNWVPYGPCELSWSSRLGQSGALLTYITAVIALVPFLYNEKARVNLTRARKELQRLEPELNGLRKSLGTASAGNGKVKDLQAKVEAAKAAQRKSNSYERLQPFLAFYGVALVLVGTVLQVIENGS